MFRVSSLWIMFLSDSEDDTGSIPVKGVTNTGAVRSERLIAPGYFLDK